MDRIKIRYFALALPAYVCFLSGCGTTTGGAGLPYYPMTDAVSDTQTGPDVAGQDTALSDTAVADDVAVADGAAADTPAVPDIAILPDVCAPSCTGKVCGPNGCGGNCGTCAPGSTCGAAGTCVVTKMDCGAVTYQGCCDGDSGLKYCDPNQGLTAGACPAATPTCTWDGTNGVYTCGTVASSDPSGTYPRACPGTCTPKCDGKVCGPDGCGGSCGTCTAPETCSASGQCAAPVCTPSCAGKVCGSDGCGSSCGTCTPPQTCSTSGQCTASTCTPSCTGKLCGSDGCGGSCGTCTPPQTCDITTKACACDFFAQLDYTFDASGANWDNLFGVHVVVHHKGAGSTPQDTDFLLNKAAPTKTWTVYGCVASLDVTRTYYPAATLGYSEFTLGPESLDGKTAIAIPDMTCSDTGLCTAPSLK